MAGSYNHCRSKGGKFRFDLIENMGDAHEACEEMFWMIHVLTEGDTARIKAAERAAHKMLHPHGDFDAYPDDDE